MNFSDVFRKFFAFKTAEVTRERDLLKERASSLQAIVKTLQSENIADKALIERLNKEITVAKAQLGDVLPPAPKVNLVQVTGAYVEAAFQKLIGQVDGQGMPLFAYGAKGMARVPLDGKYQLAATRADLEAMIHWGLDEDKKYAEDYYDCENYAVYLKGLIDRNFLCNGIGIVIDWTSLPGAHAYNVAMLAGGTVVVVEPQDGKVYTLQEKSALYRALTGVMLF